MRTFIIRGRPVFIDDEDYHFIEGQSWSLNKGKYNRGYYAMYGIREGRRVRKVYLQRLVAGACGGDRVEFISSNTLDCRRRNLRKNGRRLGCG